MGQVKIYPFATIGNPGAPYPDWIRDLKTHNGVYLLRRRGSDEIAYIGESHSSRLYGTLTRHFQYWSPKHETAGPTYYRDMMEVAVIVVPKTHARQLQYDLICALAPTDNRMICDPDYRPDNEDTTDTNGNTALPRGYDYDLLALIDAVFRTTRDAQEHSHEAPF